MQTQSKGIGKLIFQGKAECNETETEHSWCSTVEEKLHWVQNTELKPQGLITALMSFLLMYLKLDRSPSEDKSPVLRNKKRLC